MPTLTYERPGWTLTLRSIELTPISLGWKDARHRRGRPRLAAAEEEAPSSTASPSSRPFGTELCNEARRPALRDLILSQATIAASVVGIEEVQPARLHRQPDLVAGGDLASRAPRGPR